MNNRNLPGNINRVYNEYLGEKDSYRKLMLLFNLFGQILRFLGCIFLSQYMYSYDVDNAVNNSIMGLSRPSLGSWLSFIKAYSFFVKKKHDMITNEICDCVIEIFRFKDFKNKYEGRFRNEAVGKANAFEEIIMLRNKIVHGASCPSMEESKNIVEVYNDYIEIIIDRLSNVFEKLKLVKIDSIEDDYYSIRIMFTSMNIDGLNNKIQSEKFVVECPSDEETSGVEIDDYYRIGDIFIVFNENNYLKVSEYLVEIIDDDVYEDYYLYDGYGNKNVEYVGARYSKQIESYLNSIKSKFIKKGACLKWSMKGFEFESFVNYINNLSTASVNVQINCGKYNNRVYVERECDYLLDDFLSSDKTTLVIKAEAGYGKTNFLCHSTEKLIQCGNAVYFFNGNTLLETKSESILFNKIKNDCLDVKDFSDFFGFLRFLNEKNVQQVPLVLMIDAANEAYDTLGVLSEIDGITSIGDSFPWLKVIVSVRTVSFNLIKERITDIAGKKMPFYSVLDNYYYVIKNNEKNYFVEIEELNLLQEMEAFENYNNYYLKSNSCNMNSDDTISFHLLSRDLKYLLRNPINMGLYFEAKARHPEIQIESEDDLYAIMERSWADNDEVTRSMSILQKKIVQEMISEKSNSLDADIVHEYDDNISKKNRHDIRLILLSPLERLRDAGIIYEREENGVFLVSFVYQKYLEHCILDCLKSDGISIKELIDQMLLSMEWKGMPEMFMAYLKLLVEKCDQDTAYLLYNQSKSKNIKYEEIQFAINKLWNKIINIEGIEIVAKMICDCNLFESGLMLINELYSKEETAICLELVNYLLEVDVPIKNDLYYQRGICYMKVSDLEKSEKDFEKCIDSRQFPLCNKALTQLAKNYRKKGEVGKAILLLENFLDANDENAPYYADALIQRGLCSYSEKKYEDALSYYNTALSISKMNKDDYLIIYNMLGISSAYADIGDYEKCESVLLDVYNRATKHGYIDCIADCLNGLSANYVRKGEYNKAILFANQGLEIWLDSGFITGQVLMYCTIVNAYIGLNKKESAYNIFEKITSIVPLIKETVILDEYNKTIQNLEQL